MKKCQKVTFADEVSMLRERPLGKHTSEAAASGNEEVQARSTMTAEAVSSDDKEHDLDDIYFSYIRSFMIRRNMDASDWDISENPEQEGNCAEATSASDAQEKQEKAFDAAAYEHQLAMASLVAQNIKKKREAPVSDGNQRGTSSQREVLEEVTAALRRAARDERDGTGLFVAGIHIPDDIIQDWLAVRVRVGDDDRTFGVTEQ